MLVIVKVCFFLLFIDGLPVSEQVTKRMITVLIK